MAVYKGQITLINVNDGTDGEAAISISSTKVYYAISQNGTTPPDFHETESTTTDGTFSLSEDGWSTVIPETPAGWYLWTKTIFTYTDGSSTVSYGVSRNGADGTNGKDANSLYTWIKYANSNTPTSSEMFDDPEGMTYMGIAYNQTSENESVNYADYKWSLIKGTDGKSSFLHIKYSDDGYTFTNNLLSTNIEDWKSGMTPASGNINNSVQGGGNGWAKGTITTPTAIWVAPGDEYYLDFSNTSITIAAYFYISDGTYSHREDYSRATPRYLTIPEGIYYIRFNVFGLGTFEEYKEAFSTKEIAPSMCKVGGDFGDSAGTWMGTCVTDTDLAPIEFGAYTWKKIEGADGTNGINGISVISIKQLYLLTSSSSVVPSTPDVDSTLGWSEENPEWDDAQVQYLWICTEINYDNGTKEYTTPYTDNNWKTATEAVKDMESSFSVLSKQVDTLQKEVDGAIETWYSTGDPNENPPDWGDDLSENHVGDLYYDKDTGYSYRYFKNDDGTYTWQRITDSDITKALEEIDSVREVADGKVTIYYDETDPIQNGRNVMVDDLWVQPDGNFMKAVEKNEEIIWQVASAVIESIEFQYISTTSNQTPPSNDDINWSSESPAWEEGYYIWQRTVTTYVDDSKNKVYSNVVCISAAAARGIIISGEQVFKSTDGVNYSPSTITLNTTIQGGLTIENWYYKNGTTWQSLNAAGATSYTIASDSSAFLGGTVATIKVQATDTSYYDIISIYKVSDGQKGEDGKDGSNGSNGSDGAPASSVFLTNENITFAANASGQVAAKTAVCNVVGYSGTTKVTPTIGTITGAPSGMTVTKGITANNEIPITITVSANATLGGVAEQSGTLEIPITSPVSTTLKINWSKINNGADGSNGKDGEDGANGKDSVSFVFGSNSITIPCSNDGYTLEDTTVNIPFTAFLGATRVACSVTLDSSLGSDISVDFTSGTTAAEGNINIYIPSDYDFGGYNSETLTFKLSALNNGTTVTSTQIFTYTKSLTGQKGEDGSNGKDGEDGKDGVSTSEYYIETNQTEILKFVTEQDRVLLSPEILSVKIYKKDPTQVDNQGCIQITDLDRYELTLTIFNIVEGTWTLLSGAEDFITTGISGNELQVDLNAIKNKGLQSSDNGSFESIFASQESVIRLDYGLTITEDNEEDIQETKLYILSTYVNIRYGMNKDMADLSLEANGLVASMQDSKLIFNANGLTVQNGSFTIEDADGTDLLYAKDGNLNLVGNIYANSGYFKGDITGATGTFSGALAAESGYFKGDITGASGTFSGTLAANEGIIGGFRISSTQLTSTDNNANPAIILDGTSGNIIAENITLGTGAKIREYIQIGENVQIKNAASASDSFITVKNNSSAEILKLGADGTITVGNGQDTIVIKGADGTIYSQNYNSGLGWKISNDESVFNNVTVKGSIKASVLEYGQVQAVGGMLLVRPSSRIISVIQNTSSLYTDLIVESANGFEVNDYCLIDNGTSKSYYQILNVDADINLIQVDGLVPTNYVTYPIVDFGQSGSVGIGINGSTNNSLITPQSISVFEFDGTNKPIPHIILGKLPNEDIYGFAKGTYGLYAENVLLKGSLVTQTEVKDSSVTYSGISTLYSGKDSPTSDRYQEWFGENTGEILLWAGATGTTKEEVELSKFFVDRNGNLFAGSGYFKGTIITDAKITASEIETATLTGTGDNPALVIQDAKKGIVFLGDSDNEKIEIFNLTDEVVSANVPSIIFNNNFKVNEEGKLVVPNLYIIGNSTISTVDNSTVTEAIILDKTRISFSESFKESDLSGASGAYIDFASGLSLSPDGKNNAIELTSQQIKANSILYLTDSVKYNELMEYKPVYDGENNLIGYDLYIDKRSEKE